MKPNRGYSLLEVLVVIAVVGVLAAVSYHFVTRAAESSREVKLKKDVAVVNEALRTYLASGGVMEPNITAAAAIAKMKTTALEPNKLAALRGTMVDVRLGFRLATSTEEGPFAYWNDDTHQFFLEEDRLDGQNAIAEFVLDESNVPAEILTEARKTGFELSETDPWIWTFSDAISPNRGGPGLRPQGNTTVTAPTGGSGTAALRLNPPGFSIPAGSYALITYPKQLALDNNANPPASSDIFYRIDNGPYIRYSASFRIDPGQDVSAFALSLDPDHYTDSLVVTSQYRTTPLALQLDTLFTKSSYNYVELGGSLAPGSPSYAGPIPGGFAEITNTGAIPLEYQKSDNFKVWWTIDGSDPINSSTHLPDPYPAFSNGFPGQPIPVLLATYGGGMDLTIKSIAQSLRGDLFNSSSQNSATLGIDQLILPPPMITPAGGTVVTDVTAAIALDLDSGLIPAGARIYYTLDGNDPGEADGNPALPEALLYTGPISVTFEAAPSVTLTARCYPPAGMSRWFQTSTAVIETYALPVVTNTFYAVQGGDKSIYAIDPRNGQNSRITDASPYNLLAVALEPQFGHIYYLEDNKTGATWRVGRYVTGANSHLPGPMGDLKALGPYIPAEEPENLTYYNNALYYITPGTDDLVRVNLDGGRTSLQSQIKVADMLNDGATFTNPGDLAIDDSGVVFFTDSASGIPFARFDMRTFTSYTQVGNSSRFYDALAFDSGRLYASSRGYTNIDHVELFNGQSSQTVTSAFSRSWADFATPVSSVPPLPSDSLWAIAQEPPGHLLEFRNYKNVGGNTSVVDWGEVRYWQDATTTASFVRPEGVDIDSFTLSASGAGFFVRNGGVVIEGVTYSLPLFTFNISQLTLGDPVRASFMGDLKTAVQSETATLMDSEDTYRITGLAVGPDPSDGQMRLHALYSADPATGSSAADWLLKIDHYDRNSAGAMTGISVVGRIQSATEMCADGRDLAIDGMGQAFVTDADDHHIYNVSLADGSIQTVHSLQGDSTYDGLAILPSDSDFIASATGGNFTHRFTRVTATSTNNDDVSLLDYQSLWGLTSVPTIAFYTQNPTPNPAAMYPYYAVDGTKAIFNFDVVTGTVRVLTNSAPFNAEAVAYAADQHALFYTESGGSTIRLAKFDINSGTHSIIGDLAAPPPSTAWSYPASQRPTSLAYFDNHLFFIHNGTDDLVRIDLNAINTSLVNLTRVADLTGNSRSLGVIGDITTTSDGKLWIDSAREFGWVDLNTLSGYTTVLTYPSSGNPAYASLVHDTSDVLYAQKFGADTQIYQRDQTTGADGASVSTIPGTRFLDAASAESSPALPPPTYYYAVTGGTTLYKFSPLTGEVVALPTMAPFNASGIAYDSAHNRLFFSEATPSTATIRLGYYNLADDTVGICGNIATLNPLFYNISASPLNLVYHSDGLYLVPNDSDDLIRILVDPSTLAVRSETQVADINGNISLGNVGDLTLDIGGSGLVMATSTGKLGKFNISQYRGYTSLSTAGGAVYRGLLFLPDGSLCGVAQGSPTTFLSIDKSTGAETFLSNSFPATAFVDLAGPEPSTAMPNPTGPYFAVNNTKQIFRLNLELGINQVIDDKSLYSLAGLAYDPASLKLYYLEAADNNARLGSYDFSSNSHSQIGIIPGPRPQNLGFFSGHLFYIAPGGSDDLMRVNLDPDGRLASILKISDVNANSALADVGDLSVDGSDLLWLSPGNKIATYNLASLSGYTVVSSSSQSYRGLLFDTWGELFGNSSESPDYLRKIQSTGVESNVAQWNPVNGFVDMARPEPNPSLPNVAGDSFWVLSSSPQVRLGRMTNYNGSDPQLVDYGEVHFQDGGVSAAFDVQSGVSVDAMAVTSTNWAYIVRSVPTVVNGQTYGRGMFRLDLTALNPGDPIVFEFVGDWDAAMELAGGHGLGSSDVISGISISATGKMFASFHESGAGADFLLRLDLPEPDGSGNLIQVTNIGPIAGTISGNAKSATTVTDITFVADSLYVQDDDDDEVYVVDPTTAAISAVYSDEAGASYLALSTNPTSGQILAYNQSDYASKVRAHSIQAVAAGSGNDVWYCIAQPPSNTPAYDAVTAIAFPLNFLDVRLPGTSFAVKGGDKRVRTIDLATGVNAIIDYGAPFDIQAIALDQTNRILYYIEDADSASAWHLGKIDLNTSRHTILGDLKTVGTPPSKLPHNLAFYGGVLYYISPETDDLIRLTVVSDALATQQKVADLSGTNNHSYAEPWDLAVHDDGMMFWGSNNGGSLQMYRYDLSAGNGYATLSNVTRAYDALAFYQGRLYGAGTGSDNVDRLTFSGTGFTIANSVVTAPTHAFVDFATPVADAPPSTSDDLWALAKDSSGRFVRFHNYKNTGFGAEAIDYGEVYYISNNPVVGDVTSCLSGGSTGLQSLTITTDGIAYAIKNTNTIVKVGPTTRTYTRALLRLDINTLRLGDRVTFTVVGDLSPRIETLTGAVGTNTITGADIGPDGSLYLLYRKSGAADVVLKLISEVAASDGSLQDMQLVGSLQGNGESVDDGEDLAFDASGQLHVFDSADQKTYRVNSANAQILTTFSSGAPDRNYQGLAFNVKRDDDFVASSSVGLMVHPITGSPSSDATYFDYQSLWGYTSIEGISFCTRRYTGSAAGYIWAVGGANTHLYAFDAETGRNVVKSATMAFTASAVAVDESNGEVYYVEQASGNWRVARYMPATDVHLPLGNLANTAWIDPVTAQPANLVFYRGGLYFVPEGTDDLMRIDLNSSHSAVTNVFKAADISNNVVTFANVGDLAIDSNGQLFIASDVFAKFDLRTLSGYVALNATPSFKWQGLAFGSGGDLYGVRDTEPGLVYSVNTTTGDGTLLSTLTPVRTFTDLASPMAPVPVSLNGTHFAIVNGATTLHRVTPSTGSNYLVTTNLPWQPTGVAYDRANGVVYCVGASSGEARLCRFDVNSGIAADLGTLASGLTYNATAAPQNLVYFANALYYVPDGTDDLIRVTVSGSVVTSQAKSSDLNGNTPLGTATRALTIGPDGLLYLSFTDGASGFLARYDIGSLRSFVSFASNADVNLSALTFGNDGAMYGVKVSDPANIHTVNNQTGATALQAATSPNQQFIDISSLHSSGSASLLYTVDRTQPKLFALSPGTGNVADIADVPWNPNTVAFDSSRSLLYYTRNDSTGNWLLGRYDLAQGIHTDLGPLQSSNYTNSITTRPNNLGFFGDKLYLIANGTDDLLRIVVVGNAISNVVKVADMTGNTVSFATPEDLTVATDGKLLFSHETGISRFDLTTLASASYASLITHAAGENLAAFSYDSATNLWGVKDTGSDVQAINASTYASTLQAPSTPATVMTDFARAEPSVTLPTLTGPSFWAIIHDDPASVPTSTGERLVRFDNYTTADVTPVDFGSIYIQSGSGNIGFTNTGASATVGAMVVTSGGTAYFVRNQDTVIDGVTYRRPIFSMPVGSLVTGNTPIATLVGDLDAALATVKAAAFDPASDFITGLSFSNSGGLYATFATGGSAVGDFLIRINNAAVDASGNMLNVLNLGAISGAGETGSNVTDLVMASNVVARIADAADNEVYTTNALGTITSVFSNDALNYWALSFNSAGTEIIGGTSTGSVRRVVSGANNDLVYFNYMSQFGYGNSEAFGLPRGNWVPYVQPPADSLFAVPGNSREIYTLSPTSGSWTLIDSSAPYNVNAIAYDRTNSILYALEDSSSATGPWRLDRMDLASGLHLSLGDIHAPGGGGYVPAVRPRNLGFRNGKIYFITPATDDLIETTVSSSAITAQVKVADIAGDAQVFDAISDLAFDDTGVLFFTATISGTETFGRYVIGGGASYSNLGTSASAFGALSFYNGILYGQRGTPDVVKVAFTAGSPSITTSATTTPSKTFIDYAAPVADTPVVPSASLWTIADKSGPHLIEIRNYKNQSNNAQAIDYGEIRFNDSNGTPTSFGAAASGIRAMTITSAGSLYFVRSKDTTWGGSTRQAPLFQMNISGLRFGDSLAATYKGDLAPYLATLPSTGAFAGSDDLVTGMAVGSDQKLYLTYDYNSSSSSAPDFLVRLESLATYTNTALAHISNLGQITGGAGTAAHSGDASFGSSGSLFVTDTTDGTVFRLDNATSGNPVPTSTYSTQTGGILKALAINSAGDGDIVFSNTSNSTLGSVVAGANNDTTYLDYTAKFSLTGIEAASFFAGSVQTIPPDTTLYACKGADPYIYTIDVATGQNQVFTDAAFTAICSLALDRTNNTLYYVQDSSSSFSLGSYRISANIHSAAGNLQNPALEYVCATKPESLAWYAGYLWYVAPGTDDLIRVEATPTSVVAQRKIRDLTGNSMAFDQVGDLAIDDDGLAYLTATNAGRNKFCRFNMRTLTAFHVIRDDATTGDFANAIAFGPGTSPRTLYATRSSVADQIRTISLATGAVGASSTPTSPLREFNDFSDLHNGTVLPNSGVYYAVTGTNANIYQINVTDGSHTVLTTVPTFTTINAIAYDEAGGSIYVTENVASNWRIGRYDLNTTAFTVLTGNVQNTGFSYTVSSTNPGNLAYGLGGLLFIPQGTDDLIRIDQDGTSILNLTKMADVNSNTAMASIGDLGVSEDWEIFVSADGILRKYDMLTRVSMQVSNPAQTYVGMAFQPDGQAFYAIRSDNLVDIRRVDKYLGSDSLSATSNPALDFSDLAGFDPSINPPSRVDRIYIGGDFANVIGLMRNAGLLDAQGAVDQTFNVGAGANGDVRAILPLGSSGVIFGGEFNRFNGVDRTGIIKVSPYGTTESSFNPQFTK